MSHTKTLPKDQLPWHRPVLVRLGSIRDIAQQGPPRLQGQGQHS